MLKGSAFSSTETKSHHFFQLFHFFCSRKLLFFLFKPPHCLNRRAWLKHWWYSKFLQGTLYCRGYRSASTSCQLSRCQMEVLLRLHHKMAQKWRRIYWFHTHIHLDSLVWIFLPHSVVISFVPQTLLQILHFTNWSLLCWSDGHGEGVDVLNNSFKVWPITNQGSSALKWLLLWLTAVSSPVVQTATSQHEEEERNL